MSRSIQTAWAVRVRRRFLTIGDLSDLEPTVATVARHLRVDPIVLLGVLASQPASGGLWTEVQRALREPEGQRIDDWSELAAATRYVASALGKRRTLSCWVVEPVDTAEAFAVASCLLSAGTKARLSITVTHSDPALAAIGQSGLVSQAALALAPARDRRAHFRHLGHCWQAKAPLRALVHFATASALHDREEGLRALVPRADLVVSRGLLSRLDRRNAARLSLRFCHFLRNGGFLLIGSGEHDTLLLNTLHRCVAPGVLLYQKHRRIRRQPPPEARNTAFASLLAAIEADPRAWQPRWELAALLVREGYAASALPHLRAVVREQPDQPRAWECMAQAYTLLGDTTAAAAARRHALLPAPVANAA